jgi:hypothetical protein
MVKRCILLPKGVIANTIGIGLVLLEVLLVVIHILYMKSMR